MLTEAQKADIREKFVKWLKEETAGLQCTYDLNADNGSFAIKGRKTMLFGGQNTRVVDVMKAYGFVDGLEVAGYDCRYSPEDEKREKVDTFRFFPTENRGQAPDFLC